MFVNAARLIFEIHEAPGWSDATNAMAPSGIISGTTELSHIDRTELCCAQAPPILGLYLEGHCCHKAVIWLEAIHACDSYCS